MLSASLAAAAAALTGPGVSPIPFPPGAFDAAVAAIVAAASTGSIPSALPTEITVWTGGFDFPIVNNSLPHPDCNELYIGKAQILRGRPEGDILEVCVNRTEGGTEWYPVLFGEALFQAIYNGNGTGLIAGVGLELIAYPNGTLFEIRDAVSITPGTCVNCIMTVGPGGRIMAFASGESVISGNQTVWKDAILRAENSALIMDENCTIVNLGPTVLADVVVADLSSTQTRLTDVSRTGECLNLKLIYPSQGETLHANGTGYNCGTITVDSNPSLLPTWTPSGSLILERPMPSSASSSMGYTSVVSTTLHSIASTWLYPPTIQARAYSNHELYFEFKELSTGIASGATMTFTWTVEEWQIGVQQDISS
jgi:hypothetical protein